MRTHIVSVALLMLVVLIVQEIVRAHGGTAAARGWAK